MPFSQEMKQANSDFEIDENFEPYETGNKFTSQKKEDKSDIKSNPA